MANLEAESARRRFILGVSALDNQGQGRLRVPFAPRSVSESALIVHGWLLRRQALGSTPLSRAAGSPERVPGQSESLSQAPNLTATLPDPHVEPLPGDGFRNERRIRHARPVDGDAATGHHPPRLAA